MITKDKVVSINYTLTDNDGVVIDTSEGREPLTYLHGAQNIIIGLERALEGKVTGDKVEVAVAPEDGYGTRIEELLREVPRANFPEDPIQPGMQFQAQSEQGTVVFTVVKEEGEKVIIDGNHPLAGVPLNFKVEIMEIRDAAPEEVEHGHVHGPGGHNH